MKIENAIKQKVFKSESEKLVINLAYTAGWLAGEQHRFFKLYGLSVQQYNVLRILRGQKGNPVSLGLIQERMLDKMSNASRLVEKLKLKKLIDRRVCKSDRRQVEVVITELGLTLLTQIDEARIQMEHITSNLNENEKQIFNQLLDKLRENKE